MRITQHLTLAFALLTYAYLTSQAQSFRLNSSAESLTTQVDEVADRFYRDYSNRSNNSRAEVEALFQMQQLRSAAELFQRLVRERRSASELRDALALVEDVYRRADRAYSPNNNLSDIRRTLSEISREMGSDSSSNGNGFPRPPRDDNDDGRVNGRMRWRGRVDDEVQIVLRGSSAELRTISGTDMGGGNNFNFTSPLPDRRASVNVVKTKGRGDVRVIQQPSRANDFTAVIQIRDGKGGASDYDLEATW